MINLREIVSAFTHLPKRGFFLTFKQWIEPSLYQIYLLNYGQPAGVFQALKLILFAVPGAVDEILAS